MRRYTLRASDFLWARPGDAATLVPGSVAPVDPPPVDPGTGEPPPVPVGLVPALTLYPALNLYPTAGAGLGAGE